MTPSVPGEFNFHPVTPDRWTDFARLFESRGALGYCWCMVWRDTADEQKDASRISRRRAMERRILTGEPTSLVGSGHPLARLVTL